MTTSTCSNKGCGKTFKDQDNSDTACEYHNGAPVFHEGLKGWSCCSKRVVDFDEFLKIPGCTVGQHQTTTPTTAPAAPAPSAVTAPVKTTEDGTEVYGGSTPKPPTPSASPSPAAPAVPTVQEQDLNDPADAVIVPGAKCLRRGCGAVYAEGMAEQCAFHGGVAVFHEGSKGWSCCPKRKVLEFDEFLKLPGCMVGKHRFTDVKPATPNVIPIRHDWYQTQSSVIISLFAKKIDKTRTTVVFAPEELKVNITFLDGNIAQFHTRLSQPIDSEASRFEMLTTKIEVVLKKANGISWPSIEPRENVTSFTTFGTTGTVGSIGSKVAVVAADAPVHLLKK
ncbi:chord-domain-containing protein [Blyttiomyces helicus]|uniref:Chord-domain-containing protein n=1 Tax=Blyttiomyces helicus TaxID=388810 RepID=A0A4P9WS38_9FUNG|nr:chord-domain-containing protein [Blyttiomyces helicus]|eukprot:RKO94110.1 chord-domain-containing protein [Blyttiomyces helicus]